jgi:signal transduction histidine kinase
MSETTVFLVAVLQLLPAAAWATVSRTAWQFGVAKPGMPELVMLAVTAALLTGYFVLQVVFTLVPGVLHDAPPPWLVTAYVVGDVLVYHALAVFRHSARLLRPAGGVSSRWLAWNYGLAALMSVLAVIGPRVFPFETIDARVRAYSATVTLYSMVQMALGVRDLAAAVRPARGLRTGAAMTLTRRADVALLGGVVALLVAMVALQATGGWREHPVALRAVVTAMGLLLVMPIAARNLGEVLRGLVTTTVMAVGVAAIYFATEVWAVPGVEPASQMRVRMAAVFVLVVFLGFGQRTIRRGFETLVYGRRRRRADELIAFLQGLAPERGLQACCDDAVDAVVRIGGARGGALLLTDGTGASAGAVDLAPLRAAWPGAHVLAGRTDRIIPWPQFAGLPAAALQALVEQDVAVVLPIVGPHRTWGHLFVVRSVLAVTEEGDAETTTAVTGQLALLFDVASLLERAVAVERSLAHAEKLAAIGETAARIAHEIRNPVTAARSLAQQLAREPGTQHAVELGLILEELERVERQVASLLRFARREDLRLDVFDLSDLVRSTLAGYAGRLDAARIALDVDVTDDVTARADRERIRQVLVNLLDNAVDALAEVPEPRRLAVSLTTRNGTATMQVADSGPGVDDAALPRLFEPFFSLKPSGTGLGLAIARRTVESHGGRIAAGRAPAGGLAVAVDLPLDAS